MNKSKPVSTRQLKVAQEVRACISEFFIREIVPHKGLASKIFSIPEVRISADLRNAKAYVDVMNQEESKDIMMALEELKHEIRRYVTSKMRLKYSPEIRFVLDESGVHAQAIESLLKKI